MATPAQVLANQLNAQKSTGPRSDEGKAVARFNALKHAASAQSHIIPGEDDAVLAQLAAEYHRQFRPLGPEEALLLDKIVAADWTQRRMRRLEAEVFNALIDQQDPEEQNPVGAAFIKDCEGPNALMKIHRRYEAASREWLRSLNQLRELQGRRPAATAEAVKPRPLPLSPPPPIATAPNPSAAAPRLPSPGRLARTQKIGFVFDESTPPSWRL